MADDQIEQELLRRSFAANAHEAVINGNPHGTDHSMLDAIGVMIPGSSTVQDKHISNAQGTRWENHIDAMVQQQVDCKDPTGWVSPELIAVTYNSADDSITLTGTLDYYWRGVKKSLVSPWTSTAHPSATGTNYFLSSADGDTFAWSTSLWAFSDLQIAFVQHSATDLFATREVHGTMPWQSHEDAHRTHGTYRESGGDLSSIVIASTTAANRRPAVSACIIHDEDIESTITALVAGSYTHHYLTSTGLTTFTTAQAEIVPVLVNNPYYNAFATPNWIQTLMANNSYMCVWLVAVPVTDDAQSQLYRYIWVQGQSNGTLASQQALFPQDLTLGQLTSLAPEFVFIAKVILRFSGGNWSITSVTNLTGNRSISVGSPSGFYLTDAPSDGKLYVRKDGAWEELVIS